MNALPHRTGPARAHLKEALRSLALAQREGGLNLPKQILGCPDKAGLGKTGDHERLRPHFIGQERATVVLQPRAHATSSEEEGETGGRGTSRGQTASSGQ